MIQRALKRRIIVLVTLMFVANAEAGRRYGIWSETIEYNTFRVEARQLAWRVDVNEVNDVALMKSAHIALESGFDHFTILENHTQYLSSIIIIQKYIAAYRQKPSNPGMKSYNASDTFSEIKAKYNSFEGWNYSPKLTKGCYVPDPNVIEFRPNPRRVPTLQAPEGFQIMWPSNHFSILHRYEGIIVGYTTAAQHKAVRF